jgi:hypothetical protein
LKPPNPTTPWVKNSQNILNIEKNGQFLAIPLVLSISQTYEALLHSNNYPNDHWSLDFSCTFTPKGVQKDS